MDNRASIIVSDLVVFRPSSICRAASASNEVKAPNCRKIRRKPRKAAIAARKKENKDPGS